MDSSAQTLQYLWGGLLYGQFPSGEALGLQLFAFKYYHDLQNN